MDDQANKPVAYSIKKACEITSLGKTTLYRQAQLGKLRLVRIGGRTVVPADSLRAFLNGEAA